MVILELKRRKYLSDEFRASRDKTRCNQNTPRISGTVFQNFATLGISRRDIEWLSFELPTAA